MGDVSYVIANLYKTSNERFKDIYNKNSRRLYFAMNKTLKIQEKDTGCQFVVSTQWILAEMASDSVSGSGCITEER